MWDVKTATEIISFSQKAQDGWFVSSFGDCAFNGPLTVFHLHRQIQYTEDESKAVRVVTNEVHVYNPADWSQGIVDKLRIEGITSCSVSPGRNAAVALFVAEKKVRPCWGLMLLARAVTDPALPFAFTGRPGLRQDSLPHRAFIHVGLQDLLQGGQDPDEVEQVGHQLALPHPD